MHVSTWLIIFTHKTLQCIMYVLQLGRDRISLSSRCFSHHWAGCCGDSRCIVFSRVGALCLVVHAPSSSRRSSSDRLCNAQAASIMTGAMSMRDVKSSQRPEFALQATEVTLNDASSTTVYRVVVLLSAGEMAVVSVRYHDLHSRDY